MAYSETKFYADEGSGWLRRAGLFVSDHPFTTGAALGLVILAGAALAQPKPYTPPAHSAFALVEIPNGHGSATHIGNGLYVTAAHVVGDNAEVTVNGVVSPVLWSNSSYDIALIAGPTDAASIPLSCAVPAVGDIGIAHGNPMAFADISMTGTVAGSARQIDHWKVAVPVDIAMAPGMSGGAFVVGDVLAGVNVGVALAPTGMLGASFFGLAIVVPSSVVCQLLGRT